MKNDLLTPPYVVLTDLNANLYGIIMEKNILYKLTPTLHYNSHAYHIYSMCTLHSSYPYENVVTFRS